MKMSEGVEWAIHCVVILAALPASTALPGKALAEYHGVSETYLLKHLKALTKAELLQSVPGPRGGYRLAREARSITFLDIVEAIEGKEPAFRCTEIRQRGPICSSPESYRTPCAIRVGMLAAERAWKAALQQQNIADLAEHLRETLEPRLQALSAEWFAERVR
jgi:Rrf2 family protein